MKKVLLVPSLLTISFAPLISLSSCNNPNPKVNPTGVSLSETSKELTVGESFVLTAKVTPSDASQEVEWSSDNTSVATVIGGKVKAIGEGTTNIVAKPKGHDLLAVCVINVKPETTDLSFSVSNCSMSSYTEATIDLDWQPSEDKITFSNYLFIYDGIKQTVNITPQGEAYDKPNVLKIVFPDEIDHNVNGILTFSYNDETTQISSTGSVSGIVIPKYVPPPAPRTDFNTCDWSEIIQASELLEETGSTNIFCDTFQLDDLSTPDPYDKKNATSLQDFIGQERQVNINGKIHKVIVLDTQKDTIYEDENVNNGTKATLTFQFKNVICNSGGSALTTTWVDPLDTAYPDDYWDSVINVFLNDTTDQYLTSVYEMIAEGNNDGLASGIKQVSRIVGINPVLNWQQSEPKPTRLFEPTLSNLYSINGIKETSIPELKAEPNILILYCQEGQPHNEGEETQYNYYAQLDTLNSNNEYFYIGQNILNLDDSFDCLNRCDLNGDSCSYWITTPHMCPSLHDVWSINQTNKTNLTAATNQNAVAPCFCI